jgi:hypothetical protein
MKYPLPRRTFLRGAGVALGLPWLESLAPREARAQAAAARPRPFVAMTFPCGVAEFWKPKVTGMGDSWTLSPILQPLANVKTHVNVLANVGNYGPFGGNAQPSNSKLTAALLTCTAPITQTGGVALCGTSVDQVIAQGQPHMPVPSLQVGLSTLDSYTDGMPAACSRSISWSSPTNPLFKLVDPQALFDTIVGFQNVVPGTGAALGTARRAKNKSILDFVADHATTVSGRLGKTDRAVMGDFLASVRDLEMRTQTAMDVPMCAGGTRPAQHIDVDMTPPDYNRGTHADLMIDLCVMALRCDVTRVISFMLDDARSDFIYNFLTERQFTATGSTPTGTAPLGGLYGMMEAAPNNNGYATANFWFVQKLARLAEALAATPNGVGGNLLDDAAIFFGSEMHGSNHDGLDLPVLTVGKGGGRLVTNQSIDFAKTARQAERLGNLHLTFIRGVYDLPVTTFGGTLPRQDPSFGLPTAANSFGAGTTPIPEILA